MDRRRAPQNREVHTSVAAPSGNGSRVELRPAAVVEVKRGHPWVWRGSISPGSLARFETLSAGADIELVGPGGAVVGGGIADPGSPIAARVWTSDGSKVDDALL